jgi:hypothetical protein
MAVRIFVFQAARSLPDEAATSVAAFVMSGR